MSGPYSLGMLHDGGVKTISDTSFAQRTGAGLGMSRVIAAKNDPETTRSYWTMSRGDADRAFRSARRHSRMVRILRIAVPASVVSCC